MIRCYDDFIETLLKAGFSLSIGDSGIYAAVPWGWFDPPPYDTPVSWNAADPDISPWVWRMRVLEERTDIAYGKFFFKKSGYITKEWAPYFLAVRRGGDTFADAYKNGEISHVAKQIYDAISDNGILPSNGFKHFPGFDKSKKSAFERGLVELQMKMFITMCGQQRKSPDKAKTYGMAATLLCTTENFWDSEVFDIAAGIRKEDAFAAIRERILELNPAADEKNIVKFIYGN